MTTTRLESFIYGEPFRPYRLILADGEEVLVRRARKAHISGPYLACVGICRCRGKAAAERLRIIPIEQVRTAQMVEAKDVP